MKKRSRIHFVKSLLDFQSTIEAVNMLNKSKNDKRLLEDMYRMTIENRSHSLTEAINVALNKNDSEACRRICDIALNFEDSTCRRWALVYLSLMEYRDAREAVLAGLRDPDPSVQLAAAFNTSLYCGDDDIREAAKIFFERRRIFFVLDGWCRLIKHCTKKMSNPKKEFKEYFPSHLKTTWEIEKP